MKTIIQGIRGLCEEAVASGGETAEGFAALLSCVEWDAALEPAAAIDAPPAVVPRYLSAACDRSSSSSPATHGLAQALAKSGHELRWQDMYQDYEDEPDMAVFRRAYAYTLLVGPESPLRSERAKAGFTLQGPDVLYPPHAHKAKELYAVIGGTGDWRRGVEPWTARPPGDLVLHPSGVRHAMQTGEEPVLAFVAWISDIHLPVVIVRG